MRPGSRYRKLVPFVKEAGHTLNIGFFPIKAKNDEAQDHRFRPRARLCLRARQCTANARRL
jgi:hypothetical protein